MPGPRAGTRYRKRRKKRARITNGQRSLGSGAGGARVPGRPAPRGPGVVLPRGRSRPSRGGHPWLELPARRASSCAGLVEEGEARGAQAEGAPSAGAGAGPGRRPAGSRACSAGAGAAGANQRVAVPPPRRAGAPPRRRDGGGAGGARSGGGRWRPCGAPRARGPHGPRTDGGHGAFDVQAASTGPGPPGRSSLDRSRHAADPRRAREALGAPDGAQGTRSLAPRRSPVRRAVSASTKSSRPARGGAGPRGRRRNPAGAAATTGRPLAVRRRRGDGHERDGPRGEAHLLGLGEVCGEPCAQVDHGPRASPGST